MVLHLTQEELGHIFCKDGSLRGVVLEDLSKSQLEKLFFVLVRHFPQLKNSFEFFKSNERFDVETVIERLRSEPPPKGIFFQLVKQDEVLGCKVLFQNEAESAFYVELDFFPVDMKRRDHLSEIVEFLKDLAITLEKDVSLLSIFEPTEPLFKCSPSGEIDVYSENINTDPEYYW